MGGLTAHSTFKIPLKLNDTSTCSIYKQSNLKGLIQKASLVIRDEAPMTHRHAFEAVDRSLRDLMDNDDEPFGGKVFVLSGDFRQILPVVVRGTPVQTLNACLKSSTLWPQFQQLHLRENMKVMSAPNERLYQDTEGHVDQKPVEEVSEDHEDEDIRPGAIPRGLARMVDEMYADINNPEIANDEYFANRTILTTTNAVVQCINEAVAQRLEGVSQEYLSTDSVEEDEEVNFFEQEVLHTVNINDLGLCNGTRLRIVELKTFVIHAAITTGERQGQHVLIPRIVFISGGEASEFPFRLRRKQFPVQPAFAMTINKAQGQTVQNLGLYLSTPCFLHGQLYVALSRVTSRSKLKALIEYPQLEEEDGVYTDNIVYRQIFEYGLRSAALHNYTYQVHVMIFHVTYLCNLSPSEARHALKAWHLPSAAKTGVVRQ
ncbi:hypothetical protein PC120_g21541 [Phytophthora cactorum]|nr:hypothetical protein PC120_g21541 [Phytophthora cactorum]